MIDPISGTGGSAQRAERPPSPTLVVAHRGAWGTTAPQNSLHAFEQAIALGCDAVELDVRRTADGQLVVVHDARVTGRLVAHSDADSVRRRMKDGQAPGLGEVLDALAGRILLDIELKEPAGVEQVMATIAARLTPEQYVITSFHPRVLPEVKREVAEARTGILIGSRRRLHELERRVRLARVDFIAPHAALARRGLLAWAAEHDLPAWLWTVNDRRTMRRLQSDPRVAAIITDRPERALGLTGGRGT